MVSTKLTSTTQTERGTPDSQLSGTPASLKMANWTEENPATFMLNEHFKSQDSLFCENVQMISDVSSMISEWKIKENQVVSKKKNVIILLRVKCVGVPLPNSLSFWWWWTTGGNTSVRPSHKGRRLFATGLWVISSMWLCLIACAFEVSSQWSQLAEYFIYLANNNKDSLPLKSDGLW